MSTRMQLKMQRVKKRQRVTRKPMTPRRRCQKTKIFLTLKRARRRSRDNPNLLHMKTCKPKPEVLFPDEKDLRQDRSTRRKWLERPSE